MKMNTVLSVKDLHTSFFTSMGEVKAVDGVSFDVHKGEIPGSIPAVCFATGASGKGK